MNPPGGDRRPGGRSGSGTIQIKMAMCRFCWADLGAVETADSYCNVCAWWVCDRCQASGRHSCGGPPE